MRVLRVGVVAASLGMVGYAMPTDQMPPNTIKLSDMMQQLSAQPGFTEAFLAQIQGAGKKAGAAFLTPDLIHHMREIILGKQWDRLDSFPGWTMAAINPTVRVVGHLAGKDQKVDSTATAGGAPAAPGTEAHPPANAFLDLGDYKLNAPQTVDLNSPATGEGFVLSEFVTKVGDGVTRGDGPNPELAPLHAASTRLADALNRLSLNGPDSSAPFTAQFDGKPFTSPQDLIAALIASGHTVEVADSRFFANFGHLHWNGHDVMMPFWVNSQLMVPTPNGTTPRPLLVPVSHAEYEWTIKGPTVNASVSFYFGIDGKAEFRTMDQLDQAWVMHRHAHTYRDADAVEVTRLAGKIVQAYTHLHTAHPSIPFGGYYAFGVCQDVVAAIEIKMTGVTTLFPNTADASFFTDPRDAEINDLIKRLPKDRDGKPPEPERIFGSLPVGGSDAELATVSIPGLGADLVAVHDAWTNGTLEREGERRKTRNWLYLLGALLTLGVVMTVRHKMRRR